MTHDDVGDRRPIGDVGPVSEDRFACDTAFGRGLGEGVEHALLVIDADEQSGGRHEGECRAPTAAADVEHGAPLGQCLPGCLMRGGVGDGAVGGEELRDRVDPGVLRRLSADLVGDGPGGQVVTPFLGRGRHAASLGRPAVGLARQGRLGRPAGPSREGS